MRMATARKLGRCGFSAAPVHSGLVGHGVDNGTPTGPIGVQITGWVLLAEAKPAV
jgi:hypothetical protein